MDICGLVLPHLATLLDSKHDIHANTAVASLRVITSSFGDIIKRGGNQGVPSIGVDVMKEERWVEASFSSYSNVILCLVYYGVYYSITVT